MDIWVVSLLGIMTNVALNTHAQPFMQMHVPLIPFGYVPGSGISGSYPGTAPKSWL